MKKEDFKFYRELAFYASLGMTIALSIFIGFGLGFWVDSSFNTSPWGKFIGLGLGIAAGFRNILLVMKRSKKL
jgi:ATP synthase protein I